MTSKFQLRNKAYVNEKRPFKLEDIWRIRTRLELEGNVEELALFNLAIDYKLRSCYLLMINY